MASRIRVRDRGYNRTKSRLAKLKAKPIKMTVGVHNDAGTYPNGTPVVEVATIQEFGIGVPAQPFILPVFDADRSQHKAMLRRVAEGAVRRGDNPVVALKKLGDSMVERMQRRAPVKTGKLRGSIKRKVER